MTTVFVDASGGGRDGHLGRLAAARGYVLRTVLEKGVQICVMASNEAQPAPSVTTSKRAKRMMLPASNKQLTTADVCLLQGFCVSAIAQCYDLNFCFVDKYIESINTIAFLFNPNIFMCSSYSTNSVSRLRVK
jgi:hypothetical protein